MQVKVKLFASLRETIGYSEKCIDIREGDTLEDLWKTVSRDAGWKDEILMAVNMDYANPDVALRDGDEVAFFPPGHRWLRFSADPVRLYSLVRPSVVRLYALPIPEPVSEFAMS